MCTFKKVEENVEVDVVVQKEALGFRIEVDYRCASFIQFTLSSSVVIW